LTSHNRAERDIENKVVLVTRPDPDGAALCTLLEAQGIQAVNQPLIRFSAGSDQALLESFLHTADLVIAVSKQAVIWADKMLRSHQQSWPSSVHYLAVGEKTAQQLTAVTSQSVRFPRVSDSEHLLALPELQATEIAALASKNVLILRGNSGRELIYSTLEARGAIVSYCEVYQRHRISFKGNSPLEAWKDQAITHMVVTSAEQLTYLHDGVSVAAQQWLYQRILIVPSERIACLARQMGFYTVTVSASASNQDLLRALSPHASIGQQHDK
jgi:uroporphyrinogen-III synthase